jgi:ribonuclease P protein component
MQRLKQRAEFLAAAAAAKAPASAFILQARRREDEGPARVGFTVSRKVGTAVERNRMRRRLRALVRRAGASRMRPGYDYVLIGRRAALTLLFTRLVGELERALDSIHEREPTPSGRRGRPAPRREAPGARQRMQ